ncbi:sodium-coupled monocarboxylate transporter 2-like [Tenebrio molitor]|uniref:sodium-coupled monocarboxylate transporter 2-like n=1 Tax=Tenebrio molitor TaxID=7067 RepID=UPI0036247196
MINTTVSATLVDPTKPLFSWYDYILFCVMLVFSSVIGIYFGCFGSKQRTANEYLLGGNSMKPLPVAISLTASHISGISLLGLPADAYRYGGSFLLGGISMLFVTVATIFIYIPVFFDARATSMYEYLERRFDHKTRLLASFLYVLATLLANPVIVYVAALAFSTATGLKMHLVVPVVCCICVFYTSIGGVKTVIWTDAFQFIFTVGALMFVFVLGVRSSGGFSEVWTKALNGERLNLFDFSPDLTKRDGFWVVIVGLTFHWMGTVSIHQTCIQKLRSVPTYAESKLSLIWYGIGLVVVKAVCVLIGFVMYAKYASCDPLTTKKVTKNDQLVPYFVMDVAKDVPGLSGIFIAGIVSAGLSTLSASLNCLAGTIYEDFLSKFLPKNITEKTKCTVLKLIVITTGIVCLAMNFIVDHLGAIIPLNMAIVAISNGPLLGVFTVGLLFPRVRAKGAFYGAVTGLICISSIVIPAKYYQSRGLIKDITKPLSTESCQFFNESAVPSNVSSRLETFEPHSIFKISHFCYTLVGAVATMVVSIVISYLTNDKDDLPIDESLISPVSRSLLKKEVRIIGTTQYRSVDIPLDS